ncbi:uncharacterized protein LOC131694284 [Topomyia yanbarensis]|uniref:uncharacterized protein LOC131694284 n=1 Tax=Topomyia yanbarensis TaxID=2498891 RepID=UPI00273AC476|nr:uncharacterized protein LOC131694284 [Topomyia yanbarensis]
MTHRTLGRTAASTMEALDPPATVEPLQPAFTSRPGPVCRSGEGVFQIDTNGNQSRHSNLQIYYQNAGGMNSVIEDYLVASSDECFDIIALTETWLGDSTLSVQAFGANYDVFRTDRSSRNSLKATGGGVLVAIHRRLKAQLIDDTLGVCVEQVWVRIKLAGYALFLCVVYLPPDRTRDSTLIDSHTESLERISA